MSPWRRIEVGITISRHLEQRLAGVVGGISRRSPAPCAMKPDHAVTTLAETIKLLGDPTRVKIVFAISREELCVCDLANLLGVSQSAVSHSLRALRQMRFVRFRKEGKIAYYALDDEHIAHLLDEGFRRVEELLRRQECA